MILSPAKTLDLSPYAGNFVATEPDCNAEYTMQIARAMKQRNQGELGKLLGVSANLVKTASGYWQDYVVDASKLKKMTKENHVSLPFREQPTKDCKFTSVAIRLCVICRIA